MTITGVNTHDIVKFTSVFFLILTLVAVIPYSAYSVIAQGESIAVAVLLIVGAPAVAALDGAIVALLFVASLNLTMRISGGIRVEVAE